MDLNETEIILLKELSYCQFSIQEIALSLEKNLVEFETAYQERGELWRIIEGQRLLAEKQVRDKIFALANAGDPEMITHAQRLITAQKLKTNE